MCYRFRVEQLTVHETSVSWVLSSGRFQIRGGGDAEKSPDLPKTAELETNKAGVRAQMHGTPEPVSRYSVLFPVKYASNPDAERTEVRGKLAAELKARAQKNTTGLPAETATETTPRASVLKWTQERKGG